MDYYSKNVQIRILKILQEAFELAWTICDAHYTDFCVSTIVYVIAQILPTAFILNTAYWPLYQTTSFECVCLCGIYNLECLHIDNFVHSLHLKNRIIGRHAIKVANEKLKITEAHFEVNPNDFKNESAFKVHISLDVQNVETLEKNHHFLQFRLRIHHPVKKQNWSICFEPNPLLLNYYGKVIPTITPEISTIPKDHTVTSKDAPPFTIAIDRRCLRVNDFINI